MGSSTDGTAEADRVNEVRREIEGIRFRIAVTIDALAYKVDVPSRLADVLSDTASSFTTRLMQRLPRGRQPAEAADGSSAQSEAPSSVQAVDDH